VSILHVEYAGRRIKYGILFMFSLFYEYNNLEYVHIHVIYRVHEAGCVIHFLVAASQEYVNTYSTRRVSIDRLSGVGASAKVLLPPSASPSGC